jgi:hypothetical protein
MPSCVGKRLNSKAEAFVHRVIAIEMMEQQAVKWKRGTTTRPLGGVAALAVTPHWATLPLTIAIDCGRESRSE